MKREALHVTKKKKKNITGQCSLLNNKKMISHYRVGVVTVVSFVQKNNIYLFIRPQLLDCILHKMNFLRTAGDAGMCTSFTLIDFFIPFDDRAEKSHPANMSFTRLS